MEEYRWSPSQFVFERFTPAAENNTAAKNAFYIELASSGQRLQVAADQTIAQVLQHAGVEVMLSCEQGMCGSCITGVLDGIPEHRDSVLTAEEKAGNDQITLCCSRAKSRFWFWICEETDDDVPLLLRAACRDQPRPTPGTGAARRLADAGQR